MQYKLLKAIIFLFFVLISTAERAFGEAYTIGLSMHFMRDDYAVKLVDTVAKIVDQHPGSRLVVTDANATAQKQLADMENLVVQGVDAIIVGAEIVQALQTIVSRKLNPGLNGVVSVTEFVTDGKRNILPGEAVLSGDARAPEINAEIETKMRRIIEGVCRAKVYRRS